MSARVLLDTNVLVYAYDRSETQKQKCALELLDRLVTTASGVLSTQVLAEFFVAVTRKIRAPLSVDEGYGRIRNYLQVWPVVDVTPLIVLEAARGVRDHQLSFWDAQIWATARLNQVPLIFSEDLAPRVTEGVRFVNPFAADFDIGHWL